jgi:hypothetical protein
LLKGPFTQDGGVGSGEIRQAWNDLGQETDPSIFLTDLQELAKEAQRLGEDATASALWQESLRRSYQHPQFKTHFESAQKALDLFAGKGSLPERLELRAAGFLQEATDPWLLLGFGLGATTYRAVKVTALARTLKAGAWAPRIKAALWGLGAESAVFLGTTKLGRQFTEGAQDFKISTLGREYLGTVLTFGLLKSAGLIAQRGFDGFHGFDPYTQSFSRLSSLTRLTRPLSTQVGMLSGLWLGEYAQEKIGWLPGRPWDQSLWDSFVTLMQLNLAGGIAHRLMGPRWHHLNDSLDHYGETLMRGRLSSLQGALSKNFTGWAVASPGTTRGTLGENQVYMSGDGKDPPGKGKVVPFRRPAPRPTERKETKRVSHDLVTVEAESVMNDSETFWHHLRLEYGEALSWTEIWLRHFHRKRTDAKNLDPIMHRSWRPWRILSVNMARVGEYQRRINEILVASQRETPQIHERLERQKKLFRKLTRKQGSIKELSESLPGVMAGHRVELVEQRVDRLKLLYGEIFHEFSRPEFLFSEDLAQHRGLFEGIEGMLYGVGAKEFFRGTKFLEKDPDRKNDYSHLTRFLYHLEMDLGDGVNLLKRLTYVLDLGAHGRPRMLIHHMDPKKPLMGWFSLVLPAVLARFGGSYAQARVRLKAFDSLLPEELRRWTPVTLWALSQSLTASREPLRWFEHLPPEVERDFKIQDRLGEVLDRIDDSEVVDRDLANAFHQGHGAGAVPHALLAFLRSPYGVQEALETAALAPTSIREDAMALTGALLGGFHGKRIFSLRHVEEFSGKSELDIRNWYFNAQTLDPFVARLREGYQPQPENVLALPSLSEPPSEGIDNFAKRLEEIQNNIRSSLSPWRHRCNSILRRGQVTGVARGEILRFFETLDQQVSALRGYMEEISDYLKSAKVIHPINREAQGNDPKIAGKQLLSILERELKVLEEFKGEFSRALIRGKWLKIKPEALDRLTRSLIALDTGLDIRGEIPSRESTPRYYSEGSLRDLFQASTKMGPSSSMGLDWEWDLVREVVRRMAKFRSAPFSWEQFFTIYEEPDRPYEGREGIPLASYLNVLTPASLVIRRQEPHRIYPELVKLRPRTGQKNIDTWRGVTYLTARLLQGAEPSDWLLVDAFFTLIQGGTSPMASRFRELAGARMMGRDPLKELLKLWKNDRIPVERAALGIHAFLEYPQSPQAALDYAGSFKNFMDGKVNPDILRVTAILSAAYMEGSRPRSEP